MYSKENRCDRYDGVYALRCDEGYLVSGNLALFHYSALAASLFAPFSASLCESLDTIDATGPEAFHGRAESVASLAADDADGLEDGFAAVAPEDGGVVDPF